MTQLSFLDQNQTAPAQASARFDGATIEPQDVPRLANALARVYEFMADGNWHTLHEVAIECHTSEAGASARLRDLRKARFGSHNVERRRVNGGLFEYRIRKSV